MGTGFSPSPHSVLAFNFLLEAGVALLKLTGVRCSFRQESCREVHLQTQFFCPLHLEAFPKKRIWYFCGNLYRGSEM